MSPRSGDMEQASMRVRSPEVSTRDTTRTEGAQPLSKRRRIALACSNCRHRKSRCDGRRPKCSLCNELGCECLYEQGGMMTSVTFGRNYITQLESRLVRIEDSVKQLQHLQSRSGPKTAGPSQDESGEESVATTGSAASGLNSNQVYSTNATIEDIDSAEDSIDGMGAIKFTDEEDCGYYGPSSNIAFIRRISLAMTRGDPHSSGNISSPSRIRAGAGWSVSRRRVQDEVNNNNSTLSQTGVNIYALPTEARTWSLIEQYFKKSGQLLPLIHEENFCETYFQMKRNNFTMIRRTWLGLLNIILALATTLSIEGNQSAQKRIEESDIYYQRAQGLCDKESRRNSGLELVQYLLILGQYLQSTQKSVQAWTVHGLAITAALQLGLHSPRTNQEFSSLECEIRKRVWFGCLLLDRALSMTFGRPAIIPDRYVCLDLPLSKMQIVGRTTQDTPVEQMDAMFFIATIKLYKVMHQIIDTCYGQNLDLDDIPLELEPVSLVLNGGRQLDKWKDEVQLLKLHVWNLPIKTSDLQQMDFNDVIVERFNIVLSLRYHNLRILLHRTILERFLDRCGIFRTSERSTLDTTDILHQVGISSIAACFDSATIIISIVRTVVMSDDWHRDLLGAWNYSAFYTFNAGLVIFASILVSQSEKKSSTGYSIHQWEFLESAPVYLTMAIEALRKLDPGNSVIERCVNYLLQLSAVLNSSIFTLDQPPNSSDDMGQAMPFVSNENMMCSNNTVYTGANFVQTQAAMQMSNQGLAGKSWPVDMVLNEFMLDTDLDFFARSFDEND